MNKDEKSNKGALIAIDFDFTISSKHTHNMIVMLDLKHADEEKQWEAVKDVKPRGTAQEWKNALEALLKEGHDLAILSENLFPRIVYRFMQDIIGLSETTISQIYLNCESTKDRSQGKNEHLKRANNHFKRSEGNRDVILVEDSQKNIDIATKANLLHPTLGVILAPTTEEHRDNNAFVTAPHLTQLLTNSQKLKPKVSGDRTGYSSFYSQSSSNSTSAKEALDSILPNPF